MSRLGRTFIVAFALVALAATMRAAAPVPANQSPILQRFLSVDDPAPTDYRALRRLEARNDKFNRSAWMDVWTEVDRSGAFRYEIVSQGGSEYIRGHVMLAALETEQKMWGKDTPSRGAVTAANYTFEDHGPCDDGLVTFGVKPLRKDVLLVDGAIFVRPEDGELMRIEGQLSKAPSFWTRRVEIVRWYQRVAGIRMPVVVESTANVRIAGTSTFRMSYEYESVNGQRVGSPQPRPVGTSSQ